MENMTIRNVVIVGRVATIGINLIDVYRAYPRSDYNPNAFPGLKFPIDLPLELARSSPPMTTIWMSVFDTGRALFIGKGSEKQVAYAFRQLKRLLVPFYDPTIPEDPTKRHDIRIERYNAYKEARNRLMTDEEFRVQREMDMQHLQLDMGLADLLANQGQAGNEDEEETRAVSEHVDHYFASVERDFVEMLG